MDPIERALAELRAIPTTTAPEPTPTTIGCHCDGSRRAYNRHIRYGEEACAKSKEAAAAYMRDYYDRTGRGAGRRDRHRAAHAAA